MKILALSLGAAVLLTACSGGGSAGPSAAQSTAAPPATSSTAQPSTPSAPATQPSKPVATESNPPGDIPDNQAYVAFQGAGFSVKVPEGWARTVTGTTTSFTDKLNRIETTPSAMSAPPTAQSVQT
ncbi:MAG TPA: hypothetical protein VFF46_06960, partial [Kribbella sp.]|nr:hypothetical protein [Kribbella sp.]